MPVGQFSCLRGKKLRALAVTLGLAGARYARQGVGRMWPAATGTVLGAAGFVFPMVLLSLMY
ncbi:hypothetical protein GCM10023100_12050 [Actinocorallia cavernae]|uniref:Uncharacterized protein n=2 Tax=Actinomycetes TaxID=1760 RepID=A0ABP5ZUU5_9ACTN